MKAVRFMAKTFVRLLFLVAVTGAFYGLPFCWLAARAERFLWALVLTLLLGRFFCDALCPLGIVQSLVNWVFHPRRHVRRVCTRLPETKAQRIVRWSVLGACVALAAVGCAGFASMPLPMSVYGKALLLWWPGVTLGAVVVVLAAFGKGRIWCNWVCPYGTVFNLVSRLSLVKDKVGPGCDNCRLCFPQTKREKSAGDQSATVSAAEGGATRRETLKGVALLAAADKLTDGGLADVSLPVVPAREAPVLPPGAVDRRLFSLKCVGCQLCVANCPGECLKPSTSLPTFGQPQLDFRYGYCIMSCVRCGEVCPEKAIEFLQREQRPHVHLGYAVWEKDRCVRTTNGDSCTACVRKCPVRAIHLVKGFPFVNRDVCIGCGACEHVCPARPLPAIHVQGFARQRVVNPISEADLIAEMRARLDGGAAVVVARDGVIVAIEEGEGLAPLLKLYDARRLAGTIVATRTIGRAAAAICAVGGARLVVAATAGKGAGEILRARGIELRAAQTVERILDRKRKDSCPMEKAVMGVTEPEKMIEAIRKAMRK